MSECVRRPSDGLDIGESSPLSRHIPCGRDFVGLGRSTGMLSSVGFRSLQSWRFAPSMAMPMGTPAPSVWIDRFVPDLPRSVGFGPVAPPPPRGALVIAPSVDWKSHRMPLTSSYLCWPAFQNAWKTPVAIHSWNRKWARLPQPPWVVRLRAFHWQPVRSTKKMASATVRGSMGGRPPWGCPTSALGEGAPGASRRRPTA